MYGSNVGNFFRMQKPLAEHKKGVASAASSTEANIYLYLLFTGPQIVILTDSWSRPSYLKFKVNPLHQDVRLNFICLFNMRKQFLFTVSV